MSIVDPNLITRVKAMKSARNSARCEYQEDPRVGFIVHSFNRVANIDQLMQGLRSLGTAEIIVCEDGSIDGSHEQWMSHLTGPNDFLLHSNDLHEIRILDRAIALSRARIVCLVQDDDSIPETDDWLISVLSQYEQHPDLAIVGGFMGFHGFDADPSQAMKSVIWEEGPFQFVTHVNIGPYFLRKEFYEAIGGWDFSLSEVGEPGICFDSELCLRAWMNGFTVGYQFVPFKGNPGEYDLDGGTMLFSPDIRVRNQWRNHAAISTRYKRHTKKLSRLVEAANQRIA